MFFFTIFPSGPIRPVLAGLALGFGMSVALCRLGSVRSEFLLDWVGSGYFSDWARQHRVDRAQLPCLGEDVHARERERERGYEGLREKKDSTCERINWKLKK